jgi:hypothetical protein
MKVVPESDFESLSKYLDVTEDQKDCAIIQEEELDANTKRCLEEGDCN